MNEHVKAPRRIGLADHDQQEAVQEVRRLANALGDAGAVERRRGRN
jgi:hypothetical protein